MPAPVQTRPAPAQRALRDPRLELHRLAVAQIARHGRRKSIGAGGLRVEGDVFVVNHLTPTEADDIVVDLADHGYRADVGPGEGGRAVTVSTADLPASVYDALTPEAQDLAARIIPGRPMAENWSIAVNLWDDAVLSTEQWGRLGVLLADVAEEHAQSAQMRVLLHRWAATFPPKGGEVLTDDIRVRLTRFMEASPYAVWPPKYGPLPATSKPSDA
jgi:hypothetical protein